MAFDFSLDIFSIDRLIRSLIFFFLLNVSSFFLNLLALSKLTGFYWFIQIKKKSNLIVQWSSIRFSYSNQSDWLIRKNMCDFSHPDWRFFIHPDWHFWTLFRLQLSNDEQQATTHITLKKIDEFLIKKISRLFNNNQQLWW